MFRVFICMVATFFVTACSSNKYLVTYNSNPPSAQLVCNGVSQGYTPVTLNYKLSEDEKKRGYLNTVPCFYRWYSGATVDAQRTFNINQFPKGVVTTSQRPYTPGAEVDNQVAQQLMQRREYEAQLYYQQRQQMRQTQQQSQQFFQQQLNQVQQNNNSLMQMNNANQQQNLNGTKSGYTPERFYTPAECLGSVVNGQCYGTVSPSAKSRYCIGKMINGECVGTLTGGDK